MAEEFRDVGIAVNSLWPLTTVWTAAMKMLGGEEASKSARKPEIMSDAAYAILQKNSREFTGNFCVDEELLRNEGIKDFDQYAISPGNKLTGDFFMPERYYTDFSDLELMSVSSSSPAKAQDAQAQTGAEAAKVFEAVQQKVTDELKNEINAVMSFVISGDSWYVDANAERPLKVARGETEKPDVTIITDEATFLKMASGDVKAAAAFMSGKLKIKGNLAIAMKAEKIFQKVRA